MVASIVERRSLARVAVELRANQPGHADAERLVLSEDDGISCRISPTPHVILTKEESPAAAAHPAARQLDACAQLLSQDFAWTLVVRVPKLKPWG
jgi:hypothetical protein